MSSCTEGPQKTWLFPSGDVCYIGLLRQYQNSTQVATRANAETRLIASLPPRPTPIATRSACRTGVCACAPKPNGLMRLQVSARCALTAKGLAVDRRLPRRLDAMGPAGRGALASWAGSSRACVPYPSGSQHALHDALCGASRRRHSQGTATNETRAAINVPDPGVHDWGVGTDKLKALCRSRVHPAAAGTACKGTVVRPTLLATGGLCVTAGAGYDGCPTAATPTAAEAMCTQQAARLCTRSELELGLASGVRCTQQNVWSASTCVDAAEQSGDAAQQRPAGRAPQDVTRLPRWLVSWVDGRNTSHCSRWASQRLTASVVCCADLPADAVHDVAVWRSRSEPAQYDGTIDEGPTAWLTPRVKPGGPASSASSGTAR